MTAAGDHAHAKSAGTHGLPAGRAQERLARFVLCCFAAVTLAGAGSPAVDESFFVGHWYGVGEPHDPNISYIDSYRADGTFYSEFRKCERGEVVWRQTESGTWTLKDGVLRMIADTIDGKPEIFDNSYTIEYAMGEEFRMRLHEPDYLFVQRRIPKFEFPPCYVGA